MSERMMDGGRWDDAIRKHIQKRKRHVVCLWKDEALGDVLDTLHALMCMHGALPALVSRAALAKSCD